MIIGKPTGEGNFARRSGENTSYSVEPAISFETEPRYWIEPNLIDIAAANIQSLAIKPAEGAEYTVRRDKAAGDKAAGDKDAGASFTLDGVPSGRKAADSASLAPSPTAFGALTADDVTPAGDVDFSKATVATVTLSDGNVITLTGAAVGDKHWIQVQESKDAAVNAQTAGRAFEVPSYRFDAIFRPLEQLLVPKAPPPGAAKVGASSGAASAKPGSSPVSTPKKKLPPAPAS